MYYISKIIGAFAVAFFILTAAYAQTKDEIARGIYGDIPDYGEKYLSPDIIKCAANVWRRTCVS